MINILSWRLYESGFDTDVNIGNVTYRDANKSSLGYLFGSNSDGRLLSSDSSLQYDDRSVRNRRSSFNSADNLNGSNNKLNSSSSSGIFSSSSSFVDINQGTNNNLQSYHTENVSNRNYITNIRSADDINNYN